MRTAILCVALFLGGCAVDWKAKVESDTSWSGAFADRTVDGRGTQTITLGSTYEDTYCVVVQKSTKQGRLKLTIYRDPSSLFGGDEAKSAETVAEFGIVSLCNH